MMLLSIFVSKQAVAQVDPPNALAPGFGNTLTDDGASPNWRANNFLRIDPLASGSPVTPSFTPSLGAGTFTLRVGEYYDALSSTANVRALFYGGNIGLAHAGSFGNATSPASKWQGLGERIPISTTAGTNFYGLRNQWGVFASNFGSKDRAGGSERDAIITWQDGSFGSVSSADTAANRLIFSTVVSDNSFNIIEREVGTILGNGNFGLGNNNPQYLMDMFGSEGKARLRIRTNATEGFIMGFTGNNFALNNTLNGNLNFVTNGSARMSITNLGGVRIGAATQTGTMQIVNNQATGTGAVLELTNLTTPFLFVRDDGFVGVGTNTPSGAYLFEVNGDAYANSWITPSDKNFKKDFNTIKDALKKVKSLHGYTYAYKQEKFPNRNFGDKRRVGIIAQELKEVLPEAVNEGKDGYLSVEYDAIIPLLIEAIKEQSAESEKLNAELASLKYQNNILLNKFDSLLIRQNTIEKIIENLSTEPFEDEKHIYAQNERKDKNPILFQNEPNPFGQKTIIKYFIPPGMDQASIKITDSNRSKIGNYPLKEGNGILELQYDKVVPGIYYYTLWIGGKIFDTKKMLILSN